MGKVRRPYERVNMNVQNQSTRHGVKPSIIVMHSTEGQDIPNSVKDLTSLGGWFDNSASDASSHVGVDGDGYSAEFVPDDRKAWTCAFFNSMSLNIECIGRASQPKSEWENEQYRKCAQYIAYWCKKYGIPCRKGSVTRDGRITRTGILRHSDLGNLGGGHHDPGSNFDLATVLVMARRYLKNGW